MPLATVVCQLCDKPHSEGSPPRCYHSDEEWRRWRIENPNPVPTGNHRTDTEEQVLKLLRLGYTAKEMAEDLGKTVSRIKQVMPKPASFWSNDRMSTLREMHDDGETVGRIARRLRVTKYQLLRRASELGLPLKE